MADLVSDNGCGKTANKRMEGFSWFYQHGSRGLGMGGLFLYYLPSGDGKEGAARITALLYYVRRLFQHALKTEESDISAAHCGRSARARDSASREISPSPLLNPRDAYVEAERMVWAVFIGLGGRALLSLPFGDMVVWLWWYLVADDDNV